MNPLRILCFVACLVAAAHAAPNQKHGGSRSNSLNNPMKPTQWLSVSELENLPALDEVPVQKLANMPLQDGARLVDQLYHLAHLSEDIEPSFAPKPSEIPTYVISPNGQKTKTNLNQLASAAKQQPNFGDEEVTIIITGLPQENEQVSKATRKLVQAYMQRYNAQQQEPQNKNSNENARTSSEEDYSESWKNAKPGKGDIVVIDLGSSLTSLKRIALLDIEQTGAEIGNAIVQLTEECEVPQEIVHLVAQGVAAHVAGAAARKYTRATGNKLRRITALDPSKIYSKKRDVVPGLARGNAEFVDAIHTSAYGMGTLNRVGDIDFFPNGPSEGTPGSENVVEAAMRATRYFAESVRPGNERNFPAVEANSMKQYKNNNGHGKRAYMGIATDYDLEGDYILQVNSKSPFGKSSPAQKQNSYHGQHEYRKWEN